MTTASKPTQPAEPATAENFIRWTEEYLFRLGRFGLSETEAEGKDLLQLCMMSDSDSLPGGLDFRTGKNDLDLNACLSNAEMDEVEGKQLEKLLCEHNKNLQPQADALLDRRIDEEIPNRSFVKKLGAKPNLITKLRLLSEIKPFYSGIFTVHLLRYYESHSSYRPGKIDTKTFRLSSGASFDRFLSRLRAEALALSPGTDGRSCGYTLRDGPWYYRKFETEDGEDLNVRKRVLPQIRTISGRKEYEKFLNALKKGDHNKVVFWHEMTPKAPDSQVNNFVPVQSLAKKAAVMQKDHLQGVTAPLRQAEKTGYEYFFPSTTGAEHNPRKRSLEEESTKATNVSNKRLKNNVASPSKLRLSTTMETEASLTEPFLATSQSTGRSGEALISNCSLEARIQDTEDMKLEEPLDKLGNPYFDRPYHPDAFRLGKHEHESPWAYNSNILDLNFAFGADRAVVSAT